jgi:hypothetical protein
MRIIEVWPELLTGGLYTITALRRAYDIDVDPQDYTKPVLLMTDRLSEQEYQELLEYLELFKTSWRRA